MAYKWSAIEAFETHNSRREWFDGDGRFYASVKLQCKWEDRFKLIQDLYTSLYGPNAPATPSGYNPRAYPDDGGDSDPGDLEAPSMNKIGVTSATIMSWEECALTKDVNAQVLDYKSSAFIDVQYGRHYNIEETLDFDVEVVTQSYLDFIWKTNAHTNDRRLVHELEVPVATLYSAILTRDFVGLAAKVNVGAEVLVPDIATLIGSINHTNPEEYVSRQLGRTFKRGTLLMLEPEIRPSLDMQNLSPNQFGSKGFAVTTKFLYKAGDANTQQDEDTHNLFWRPAITYGSGVNSYHGGWDRLLFKVPGAAEAVWSEYRPFKPGPDINTNWLIDGEKPHTVA